MAMWALSWPERHRSAPFPSSIVKPVAPAQHSASFAGIKGRARIQPEQARTLAFAHGLGGNCMGETLLLLSCGAAFITGLVIAAASLFG
jgi:hypothetical protein